MLIDLKLLPIVDHDSLSLRETIAIKQVDQMLDQWRALQHQLPDLKLLV
jgi:hypothetical protein